MVESANEIHPQRAKSNAVPKTFANHLDDYLALQALEAQLSSNASKRPGAGKKDTAASTPKQSTHDEDVAMADDLPPVLPPPAKAPPAPHPGDDDPLLVSRVPEMPSDAELRRLLAHPPLSYLEA
ncbi:hypothetical protein J3459_013516, partial [Metarhizium acridum]